MMSPTKLKRTNRRALAAVVSGALLLAPLAPSAQASVVPATVVQAAPTGVSSSATVHAGAQVQAVGVVARSGPVASTADTLFGGFFMDIMRSLMSIVLQILAALAEHSGTPIPHPTGGPNPQPTTTPQPSVTVHPSPSVTATATPTLSPMPTQTSRPTPTSSPTVSPSQPVSPGLHPELNKVLQLVNAERAKAGVPALQHDTCMSTKVAQTWAQHMASTGDFRHQSLGNVSAKCPGMGYVGENIAMWQADASSVMNSWMNSSGHRQNILSRNYTHIGLGMAMGSNGRPYWVQNFGSRRGGSGYNSGSR